MRVKFLSVSLRNFLSYGNAITKFDLGSPGTTLIVGKNLDSDTDGNSGNGCGKSTLINALSYALFDKPVSDNITKDNLINNINKKNLQVVVEFTVGEDLYTVTRARKNKGINAGATCVITKNGVNVTPANTANEFIEEILGISYELFVRAVVFSASHTPFLDLPSRSHYKANQTDIIEELFGLTTLSRKAEELKEIIKDTEASLKTKLTAIQFAEAERERREKITANMQKRVIQWETDQQNKISLMEAKIQRVSNVAWEEVCPTFAEVDRYQGILDKTLNNECSSLARDISDIRRSIKKLEGEITHVDSGNCPYCQQELHTGSVVDIDDLKAKLDTLNAQQLDKVGELAAKDKIRDEYLTYIEDASTRYGFTSLNEVTKARNEASTLHEQLADLKKDTNPHIEALDDIEELEEINYDEVNELTKIIEHQKFLLKLLTKKDSFVRKALLDKNIPFLNKKLREYLDTLGLPHTVAFTPEMTVEIHRFGTPLDFGNLSNGQRARVNIALSFAFRDVLERLHSKIDICMLDEVIDHALDSVGVHHAIKLIKQKARQDETSIFVISHKEEALSVFDRTVVIQFEKGFSSVAED